MSDEPRMSIDETPDANAEFLRERGLRLKAIAEIAAMKNEALELRRHTVGSAIQTIETKTELTQRAIKEAYEYGDTEKMAQHQRELNALDAQRSNLQSAAAQRQHARPVPADPIKAYAAGRTERSASWIRAHPDFVLDGRKQSKLTAAHHDAIGDGLVPDTDAYEAHVEKYIGLRDGGNRAKTDTRNIHVVKAGQKANGPNQMTRGEYQAATNTLTWIQRPERQIQKGRADRRG